MFMQLGLAFCLAFLAFLVAPLWGLMLLAAVFVFGLNLLWCLYLDDAPAPVWRVLWQTPRFVFRQMIGLFKMRDPNRHFQHTEHRKKVSVEELLGQKLDAEQDK
jgi:hypothetical protein